MRYLLDTNMLIYIAKAKSKTLLTKFQQLHTGDAGMSIVTYLELIYGAHKSARLEANLQTIQTLTSLVPVLPMDTAVANHYGRLRTNLEKKGIPIGAYDLMIASHAITLGLTLVTNNTREFSRVEDLDVENWA